MIAQPCCGGIFRHNRNCRQPFIDGQTLSSWPYGCATPFLESSSFTAGDPPLRPSESLLPTLRPLPHSPVVPVGQVCGCRHGAGFRSLIPVGSPGRRIPLPVAYPSGCSFSRRLVLAASASGGYGLSFVGLPLSGRRGRAAAIGEPEFRICTESALRCS